MTSSPKRSLFLGILLIFFLTIPASQSYPNGVGEVADRGCVCHGVIQESTEIILDGLPEKYESNTSYNGVLRIVNEGLDSSNNSTIGGFRLLMSSGELVFNDTITTQILEDGWTHTEEGNKLREWNFTWVSPMDNTSYVEFKIYGNAVNGNGNPYGDEWNSILIKIPGVENYEELNTENSLYEFEFYEKVVLLFSSLAIIILAYRAVK
jgi:hypothetical protein